MPTISEAIQTTKLRGIGLVPFLPAGYPDLTATAKVISAMDAAGAAVIEVGFPFSDPIADGPTIQQSFTLALSRELKVCDIFKTVASVSGKIRAPLVAMVSYSIVYRMGIEKFCAEAKRAGFAGLIVPDLTPPDAVGTCAIIRSAGLDTILLIAPTTPPDRRAKILKLCSGFAYYLSVTGITGARDQLPPDLAENVKNIKSMTELPVCVGFGISRRQHVIELQNVADGAIVGSAIVQRMIQNISAGADGIAKAVGEYCGELLGNR